MAADEWRAFQRSLTWRVGDRVDLPGNWPGDYAAFFLGEAARKKSMARAWAAFTAPPPQKK